MKINPCYKCDDRKLGCHSSCKKYERWKKYNNEINDNRHKDDDYGGYISNLVQDNKEDK